MLQGKFLTGKNPPGKIPHGEKSAWENSAWENSYNQLKYCMEIINLVVLFSNISILLMKNKTAERL